MKKTLEDLKDDQEQKDIYKDNARFASEAFLSHAKEHEEEMDKLNKWEYYLIKIFPFILVAIILYMLL